MKLSKSRKVTKQVHCQLKHNTKYLSDWIKSDRINFDSITKLYCLKNILSY